MSHLGACGVPALSPVPENPYLVRQSKEATMFWILTAAMTVLVAVAILRPFMGRAQAVAEPAAAYDLGVYRDQLREVDRDVKRGVLTGDEADRLKTEIGRKILDADRAMAKPAAPASRRARPWVAAVVLALVVAGSAAIYGRLGSPAMPDLPLAARIAASDERLAALPSQAEAEAAAPAQSPPQADPEYLRLVEQLREAVSRRPDDPQGLELLAQHEARLGNIAAARDAQQRLIAIRGPASQAPDHVRLAALMIEAAGGFVSAEARAEIETALRIDPVDGQARYLAGLMYAQNDRPDLAFGLWRDLLETGPADAPWVAPIRQLMPELSWLAGEPNYQPPPMAGSDLPGPDAGAMAAASEMSPEEQQQMITGMVRNLEARLMTDSGPPAEWARLITSLVRIGEEARAREILARAQAIFGGTPQAMEIIDRAAATVGLVPAP